MRTLFQRASMEEDVVIFLLFGPIDPDSKVLICVKQGSKASIMGEKLFSHFSKIDPLKNDNASDVEKVTAKVSRSLTLE